MREITYIYTVIANLIFLRKTIHIIFYLCFFLNVCRSQTPQFILSEYLKYKSISGSEKPAAQYIEKICQDLNLHITTFSDTDSSYNFCASLFPLNPQQQSILFINHIDVVPVDPKETWAHPPFEGIIKNDTIYGRGAIDMKGLAIMQLFALKQFKDSLANNAYSYNVVVLFLSGEETGGKNGAAKIIAPTILSQLNPLVVLGEGGGGLTNVIPGKENELCFFISVAEKKSLWLKLEASVKSHGHGAVPSAKTANKLLLKSIQKIESTEEKIVIDKAVEKTFKEIGKIMGGGKGFVVKHINWWVFKPLRKKIFNQHEALKTLVTNSYQLTQIQNPQGSVNQVAQIATAYYDCRLLPNKIEKPLLMKLLFKIVDPRVKISIIDESPEADVSDMGIHFKNIKKSITSIFPKAHVIPVLFPATTDNSYFRSIGINAYGTLPFQLNSSMMESVHASNECLPLRAIDHGINFYVSFLKLYKK